jgi:hypothetical protein
VPGGEDHCKNKCTSALVNLPHAAAHRCVRRKCLNGRHTVHRAAVGCTFRLLNKVACSCAICCKRAGSIAGDEAGADTCTPAATSCPPGWATGAPKRPPPVDPKRPPPLAGLLTLNSPPPGAAELPKRPPEDAAPNKPPPVDAVPNNPPPEPDAEPNNPPLAIKDAGWVPKRLLLDAAAAPKRPPPGEV